MEEQEEGLLLSAVHEIRSLRRQNEILSAQQAVIEVFAAALGLRRNGGETVDVAWLLERRIEEIQKAKIAQSDAHNN